ncbi:MAG: hypothetical protein ACYTFT_09035, partial [Planctomycetota bacterium]
MLNRAQSLDAIQQIGGQGIGSGGQVRDDQVERELAVADLGFGEVAQAKRPRAIVRVELPAHEVEPASVGLVPQGRRRRGVGGHAIAELHEARGVLFGSQPIQVAFVALLPDGATL